ncbi:hypothetical protein KCP91_08815 [Microvirga sp. SRT01]|uniref:Lipoprotein n=1 Tax=Sphingomonas longa TaxID=2778730 RepID=A0ABS2D6C5_9SPHN|nr:MULTISPECIES: hypothetical protein [Alphaproteobacteria]MBM6576474.1 hypothetical protein [Sphingomonas sp. BT552]MBR7709520.1 hypothetical protein [Microvirga sp. SRT01]
MRASPLLLVLAVAGCVAPPVQRAPAPAAPVALPPPPKPVALSGDWQDWPVTPGTWSYRRDARGSLALFGQTGSDAGLTLRCDTTARQIYLSRSGAATAALTIRTSSATRAIAVQPTGGTPPYVAAAFAATDPLLDAMAFSRGRVVVEQPGAPTLVIPPYAEVGRVVQDCR